jgi:hypothetical protein
VIQEKQSVHVNWHSHVVICHAMPGRAGGIRAPHAAKKGGSHLKNASVRRLLIRVADLRVGVIAG